jgi:hypothetical protein
MRHSWSAQSGPQESRVPTADTDCLAQTGHLTKSRLAIWPMRALSTFDIVDRGQPCDLSGRMIPDVSLPGESSRARTDSSWYHRAISSGLSRLGRIAHILDEVEEPPTTRPTSAGRLEGP